ncbi:unnamed protein product [Lasius platythorax]|uniref:Uncharacterized protein n=1 Tax=Lasius platythorax TaxID=488582 RepID=A0AAV2P2I9_9HYME
MSAAMARLSGTETGIRMRIAMKYARERASSSKGESLVRRERSISPRRGVRDGKFRGREDIALLIYERASIASIIEKRISRRSSREIAAATLTVLGASAES